MKSKTLLLTGLITLVVTIIGSLIVYYITLKPEKKEILNYWFDNPTVFAKYSSSIAIQRVFIINNGTVTASNVRLFVEYPKEVSINDTSVISSLGLNFNYKQNFIKNHVDNFSCEQLLPGEKIIISYILKSNHYSFKPLIYLKSNESTGSYIDPLLAKASTFYEYYFFILIPLLAILLLLAIYFIVSIFIKSPTSINNTGFLFLHKNLANHSKRIFERAILTRGADSFIIGNYAVAKVVLGEFEDGIKLIEAATFYSDGFRDHEKAVCDFNYAIIYFLLEDKQNARLKLNAALKRSRKNISRYIAFSDLIKKIRLDKEIDQIFNEALNDN